MEQAYVGFVAFVPPVVVSGPTQTNLGQLIAAIRAVPDPGQALVLSAQMPAFTPQPALRPSIISHPRFGHYLLGLLGSWDAAGFLGMTVQRLEDGYGHHHPDLPEGGNRYVRGPVRGTKRGEQNASNIQNVTKIGDLSSASRRHLRAVARVARAFSDGGAESSAG